MNFEELQIRRLQSGDARVLFQLVQRNQERLVKYFPVTLKAARSMMSTRSYVRENLRKMKQRDGYYFLIIDPIESVPLAYFILKEVDWRIPKGELAYFVDGAYAGQGLGTWCLGKVLDIAFEELGFHKLYLLADENNTGSRRIAEKNGFRLEGILQDDYRSGLGDLVNSCYYGLIRSERKEN